MSRLTLIASAALLSLGLATAALAQGVETRAPNAKDQVPAFEGQTRIKEMKAGVAYEVTTYAEGLDKPWGMAFLPDGRLLVTERPGRLRIVGTDGKLSEPLSGLPKVDTNGQGGLLGLAIDPNFATNKLVYFSFSEPGTEGGNHTAVGRARLTDTALEDMKVIFRQTNFVGSILHYGGRLVFGRDGTLFVTMGDRSVTPGRLQARKMDVTLGKIARINADGSIPKSNPFVKTKGALPEIYSIGHRNSQAAALNPRTGVLWEVEHGTRGGDELNIVRAGKDYGWPNAAYGIEYQGKPILEGRTQEPGTEQAIYFWDPVIAPSGMAFYTSKKAPAWKDSLFIGGLGGKHLVRLTLKGDKVIGEERLLTEVGERIRDVIQGPDGNLYIATDNGKGRVLKVTPKP